MKHCSPISDCAPAIFCLEHSRNAGQLSRIVKTRFIPYLARYGYYVRVKIYYVEVLLYARYEGMAWYVNLIGYIIGEGMGKYD